MIFLKKIEAKGFKSYADYIRLNFDYSMIGIVGPNGAGKSNVIDAIKWVLGEKSIKALRGKKSDDIIFHGSNSKEQSEFAEVTLTFDNTKKFLHSDVETIAVTRRLYRGSGNTEYFINGEPTRLKDIMDIFTDTGLSKGSLGIISQGTVNWFADSKPEDRRTIFEEAAGIGHYTRKKDEALRQLERIQSNWNRLVDILKELNRDIKKLEAQATKVKEFTEKKEELTLLEISMFVKDIKNSTNDFDSVNELLKNSRKIKDELTVKINQYQDELVKCKDLLEESDIKISRSNWELNEITSLINKLEIEKFVFDNDIKSDIDSKDFNMRVNALKMQIESFQSEFNAKKEFFEKNKKELLMYIEKQESFDNQKKDLNLEIVELIRKNSEDNTTINYITDLMQNRPDQEEGSKIVIKNKDALTGILGTVLDFTNCEADHEKAISIALGKNIYNIIVNTSRDAKRGIDFLTKNKSGVATFMPIYEVTPKYIKPEHLEILNSLEGFINIASNLIKVEKKIRPIFDTLLSRIIIATDFESACKISKYTYQIYKIITLDGQIINPYGSITGGYQNKKIDSFFNLDKKRKMLITQLEKNKNLLNNLQNKSNEIDLLLIDIKNKINEKRINEMKYSDSLELLDKEITRLKMEYQKYTKNDYDDQNNKKNPKDNFKNIVDRLNNLNITKEKVENELSINESNKKQLKSKIINIEQEIEVMRNNLDSNVKILLDNESKLINSENTISNIKQKLNETYKMTIESAVDKYSEPLKVSDNVARQKIERLNKELSYMGNINMDAINELKEKSERFEKMSLEEQEIAKAREDILAVVAELDQKAYKDFSETIEKINLELPKTFKYLFGGGDCKIEFTDKNDILSSGIDIVAAPPGKHVNSLFSLSGGEKTLVALSVLFSILKVSSFPLVVLDEAESALDPANVERFGNIINEFSKETQFIVITHRPGTMERCEKLYGATMQTKGVTSMYQVKIDEAKKDFGSDSNLDENPQ